MTAPASHSRRFTWFERWITEECGWRKRWSDFAACGRLAPLRSRVAEWADLRLFLRVFIVIALTFLIGASSFTAITWSHFTGTNPWISQLVALAISGGFAAVIFLSFRRQHVLLAFLGTALAAAIGFFNYALLAAGVCWVALGVLRAGGFGPDPAFIAWGCYGVAALTTLYGLINAATLRVTRATVNLPNLPSAWHGRQVALVSDIHIGNIRGPRFIRRIVARLKALDPAAVFIAGDMFDGAKVDLARSVGPWSALRPPSGTFFVTGNHDEFSDRQPYLAALESAGLRVLHNERVVVEGLQILGVHDGETHQPAAYGKILERAGIDRARASILLAHQPSRVEIPEAAGISLQLSGHTHGGQFWPWTFLVRKIYGRFAYGLSRVGGLQVYTSSGAGSWGPPMRVGTRSEIVLLRLEPEIVPQTS